MRVRYTVPESHEFYFKHEALRLGYLPGKYITKRDSFYPPLMHFQPFHPFARTQFRKRICFQQNQFDILMYYGSFAKASGNIYAFLLFITDKDNIFLKSRRVLVVEGLIASLFDLTVSKNLIEYVHARNCLSKE